MILLIDNYDSFSYNLYQLIGSVEPDIKVIRNDAIHDRGDRGDETGSTSFCRRDRGKPGGCRRLHRCCEVFAPESCRCLGVCLGHQAICEAFGGTVSYAKELMHGKQSKVYQGGIGKACSEAWDLNSKLRDTIRWRLSAESLPAKH